MNRIYITSLITLVTAQLSLAQTEKADTSNAHKSDTVAFRGIDWLAYPYLINSLESSLAFSGGGIYFDINQAF